MTGIEQCHTRGFGRSMQTITIGLALAIMSLLAVAACPLVHAQTFEVIHNFSGPDGIEPLAGVTLDSAGNLYGTTESNNSPQCFIGCGNVFKMTRRGSAWLLVPIYNFTGGIDGANPQSKVVFGPDGSLYGTTSDPFSAGGVFRLQPPASACKSALCTWNLTTLYTFIGGIDGEDPGSGPLVFDRTGNIYGTTARGGNNGFGNVYELMRSACRMDI